MADLSQVIPVAAVVSAAVTIGIRWLDRPRAALRLEGRVTGNSPKTSGGVIAFASLINTGNGDAYDVRLYGSNVDVAVPSRSDLDDGQTMYSHRLPVVRAGETIRVHVGISESMDPDVEAALIVTWSWIGALRLRRWKRFVLTRAPSEMFLPPSILPTITVRWWERPTWLLEHQVPRAKFARGGTPPDPPDRADDPADGDTQDEEKGG